MGLGGGGHHQPLAQLLMRYLRLVRKGSDPAAPPTHTHTTSTHTITHIKYLPPRHANTDAHNSCEKGLFSP